jgi:hypothetical protein
MLISLLTAAAAPSVRRRLRRAFGGGEAVGWASRLALVTLTLAAALVLPLQPPR